MEKSIIEYLSKYAVIDDDLAEALEKAVIVREYAKGTTLLREGEVSFECYFVLKGCIRCYYLKDGNEKTAEFYAEGDVVNPVGYGTGESAPYYLECVEPTVAVIGTPESERAAYAHNPGLETLNRIIAEAMMAKMEKAHHAFKIDTPEERYIHLLKTRPDLPDRVPQYQIASYLGVTPESLSRIRRRIKATDR